jgi:hypothetical protein
MSSKLTLYIDDDVISHVKAYAKEHKLSVSKVVNNFLMILKQNRFENETDKAPITDSLQGVLRDNSPFKEDYHKHLEDKYL